MKHTYRNLKNDLKGAEEDPLSDYLSKTEKETKPTRSSPNVVRYILFFALVFTFGLYLFKSIGNISFNPFSSVTNVLNFNQPGEDLLNRMNARMIEMGYTGLDHDDLRELRSQGVTATYISNVRALGYTELTLDDAVRLAQANASSTFMAMMIELGYNLEIDDFIRLRRANVTAHYTSNIHDLGYTDVTVDQLIRLRQIGVTTALIERLQQEQGDDIGLEQVIRYRISNQ